MKLKSMNLAEVLIVIGILGVVSSITIPVLVSNYQKSQTSEQLKKAYSSFEQVIALSEQNNGSTSTWQFTGFATTSAQTNFLNTYILPYLNIAKDCGWVAPNSSCVNYNPYYLDGTSMPNSVSYFVFLSDGSLLSLTILDSYFSVNYDLNGLQKPNKMGKDIFQMGIYTWYTTKPYKFRMRGEGTSRSTLKTVGGSTCNFLATDSAGIFCGALIQQDGWRIADDYPW